MADEEYTLALNAALRLIQHSDRTEHEIRERLAKKNISHDTIDSVITYLLNEHYLNDTRYAEYYVTCYSGKRSKRRIMMDLSGKGINEDIIAQVIECCDDSEALKMALYKQLRKRNLSEESGISGGEQQKIAAALFRQGFAGSDIKACMAKELNTEDF